MRDPRAAAARVLAEVVAGGRSLSDVLPPALVVLAARDRALAQELCYGTLRLLPRLRVLLDRLLDRPLKERDADVDALLLIGLYQLGHLAVPPHAAVSATVAAARLLGKPWAAGLVNAVLRRYGRERPALDAAVAADPQARHAHPAWLLERLRAVWPADWEAVAAAGNAHPPLTLRVNRLRITTEEYRARLAAEGRAAVPHPHAPDALTLAQPCPVEALPGFTAGLFSVQDAAAQLAAPLLRPQPGQRVLDACAAPGGKTAHLLETCPTCEVVALDQDARRLTRVAENLTRLGLAADAVVGDAGNPAAWWDGRPFERILLDAPCSATGVIRRHPDIKVLRRPDDIARLAAEQERLLAALWPLLAPGGILVYATCSVLPEENRERITAFLQGQHDSHEIPIAVAWGRSADPGRQILPGEDAMDGFYYACLTKA